MLDSGRTLFAAQSEVDLHALRELSLMTAKPFLYVFNSDEAVLADEARRKELRDLVAPPTRCSWTPRSKPNCSNWTRSRRANCWSPSASPSRACTRWLAAGSTPSACRPT